ncbi:unnamed protein product [Penicillium discolor]
MCSPYPHCPSDIEYTEEISPWKFEGDPDIVITSFFVYAILTNLLAFYAYFFAEGIVPDDFYNHLDSLLRTKAQLLLKFTIEWCINPLFDKLSSHFPSSFRLLCRSIWQDRVLSIRTERIHAICLQLADVQLITGASILIILYSTHCTITQYHFHIGSQLAYLSFATFQATFMTIRDHLQGSLYKRLWRYLWIVVMFGAIFPTRILNWNSYFLVGDLYGASVQCALDKMTEGWDVVNRFTHWVLSWPSRHLLRAQSPNTPARKRKFWTAMFFMAIPCREFVFSGAFDLLRLYATLMYAAHSVIRERAEAAYQGRQGDESEWGFGQVMPVLLLAIPFAQFVEELCRLEDSPSKGGKPTLEQRPSSSHTISGRNRQHYELGVALDRSGLARAWTTPSQTSYPVSLSHP